MTHGGATTRVWLINAALCRRTMSAVVPDDGSKPRGRNVKHWTAMHVAEWIQHDMELPQCVEAIQRPKRARASTLTSTCVAQVPRRVYSWVCGRRRLADARQRGTSWRGGDAWVTVAKASHVLSDRNLRQWASQRDFTRRKSCRYVQLGWRSKPQIAWHSAGLDGIGVHVCMRVTTSESPVYKSIRRSTRSALLAARLERQQRPPKSECCAGVNAPSVTGDSLAP